MKQKKSRKTGLGIVLVVLGLILVLGGKDKKTSTISFENEPVKAEGFEQNFEGEILPSRIIIPGKSIDLKVEKAKVVNGYWEVFEDKAGWGEGSGIPGKPGNQVIFAHARDGLFAPIREMKNGDLVYVLTSNAWYSYSVTEVKEVFPNQVEVIAPTSDETLTLYTCSGYKDSKRLIIVAKRVD